MLSTTKHSDPVDEGRFRLAMLSSGIGMAIVDLEGRWRDVNPALERMLGCSAAELVGQAAEAFTHADDIGESRTALAALVRGESDTLDLRKRYLRRDGSVLWTHVNVATMRDDGGKPAYLIVQLRDISAQHAAECALQALNETLEQRIDARTAQLQEMNRQQQHFAYGISHDLRAPLRAIDGFAALLANHDGAALDDAAQGYLQRIRDAAARMSALIDSLLDLSHASRAELKLQPVDLSLLVDWSSAELADADPQRSADIVVQPGLTVLGDERQLKLLLDQLLDNAWKFSGDGVRVRIEVSGERHGDRLVVTIRDHGIGFDMRYADKLFEPFQRLHGADQAGGNGLGLAIAQRIIERHNGRLWAQSEPGAGSSFHVELPAPPDAGKLA